MKEFSEIFGCVAGTVAWIWFWAYLAFNTDRPWLAGIYGLMAFALPVSVGIYITGVY